MHPGPGLLDLDGEPGTRARTRSVFGAEVIADDGGVALPGGLGDLPVRHRDQPPLGEQPLGGVQNLLSCGLRPLCAACLSRRRPGSQTEAGTVRPGPRLVIRPPPGPPAETDG